MKSWTKSGVDANGDEFSVGFLAGVDDCQPLHVLPRTTSADLLRNPTMPTFGTDATMDTYITSDVERLMPITKRKFDTIAIRLGYR